MHKHSEVCQIAQNFICCLVLPGESTSREGEIFCKLFAAGEGLSGSIGAPKPGDRSLVLSRRISRTKMMILSQLCPPAPLHNPALIAAMPDLVWMRSRRETGERATNIGAERETSLVSEREVFQLFNLLCCDARELYPMLKSLVSEKQLSQLVYSAWPLRHLAVSVCLCVLCVRERESCVYSGVSLKFNFA